MSIAKIIDWMDEQDRVEPEDMAEAILKLLLDAIAHEAPTQVCSGLAAAYGAQREHDHEENGAREPVFKSDDEAWEHMQEKYVSEYLRVQPKADVHYAAECFEWPACLNPSMLLSTKILATIGRRMARHDERVRAAMEKYVAEEAEEAAADEKLGNEALIEFSRADADMPPRPPQENP
jgi:hypothetical protein